MFRVIALSVAAGFATSAVAQAPQPSAPQVAAPVKEKKICRSENSTGSILPKRTCKTQAEWTATDAANRDVVEQRRNQQTMGAPVVGAH